MQKIANQEVTRFLPIPLIYQLPNFVASYIYD